ncbi:MAG TPA: GGDEF domain-containing protein [Candidatus Saccharimonadia bacterium]
MPNRPPLPTDEEVITEMGIEASDADKDSLTGLASRKGLDRALDRRFGVSLVAPTQYSPDRRRGGHYPKVAVILGDGGNMKEVNDAKHLGHLVGDRMLGVTGETIKKNFRPGDIMARLGGDE